MSNNKQSSVEWYSVKRDFLEIEVRLGKLSANEYAEELAKAEQQAKAMHKREHIETYNQGYRDGEHDASNIPLSIGDISEYNNAESYYNETFGGNNEQQ